MNQFQLQFLRLLNFSDLNYNEEVKLNLFGEIMSCQNYYCQHDCGHIAWHPDEIFDIKIPGISYTSGKPVYTCLLCGKHTQSKPEMYYGEYYIPNIEILFEVLEEYHQSNAVIHQHSILKTFYKFSKRN